MDVVPKENVENVRVFAGRLAIGTSQPVRRDNRLHVCPTVSVGYTRSGKTARAGAGAHVGVAWVARNGPTLALISTAGAGLRDNAESPGAFDFGLGFVIRSRYALAPRVTLPLGGDDARPTIAIGFTYSFSR